MHPASSPVWKCFVNVGHGLCCTLDAPMFPVYKASVSTPCRDPHVSDPTNHRKEQWAYDNKIMGVII